MREKNLIDRVMHFLVHNSILFTIAIMGMVHFTLLVIMIIAQVTPLIHLNVLSVVIYVFCVILCTSGHIMPVYLSLLLEVTFYTIASVYQIGWNCGSVCFLCAIVPIIIYLGCFVFKRPQRWIIVLFLGINISTYFVLYLVFADKPPVFAVPHVIRSILVLFSSTVMIVSMIFYSTIYIYASEVEKTDLVQKNKQLSVDAQEDTLTNLLNRRGFLPVVEELMKKGKDGHFCVAFCDIDNFKRVNDTYGHDGGDEVLRHISKILVKEMQGCEICRWGGEEFVILLKDYDMNVAKEKMEYVRGCVENNVTIFYNKRIATTITIGLEEYSAEKYQEPESIIKVADERMYRGKQCGKNIVIYEDTDR